MTLRGWVLVARPPLAVLGFLAAVSALAMVGAGLSLLSFLVVLAVGLGNMGFCMLNEVVDVEADRQIKGYKPIPAGLVDGRRVLYVSATLIVASLALTVLVLGLTWDFVAFAVVLVAVAACYVYNVKGKMLGVLGNVSLFFAYVLPIVYILQLYGKLCEHVLFPLAFGLLVFAYNLVVQYQDVPGDLKAGLKTAAIELGGYTVVAVAVTSLSAVAAFVFSNLNVMGKFAFVTVAWLVFVGGLFTVFEAESDVCRRGVEWCCRRFGRIGLLAAFSLTLLGW